MQPHVHMHAHVHTYPHCKWHGVLHPELCCIMLSMSAIPVTCAI